MIYLRMFCIASVTILLMDVVWLGFLSKPLYIKHLGHFFHITPTGMKLNYIAASIVYLCLILGIMLFVLPKAQSSVISAFFWGSIFGFITYAIYDCTNLAIIKNWPLYISLIDIAWGAFLCGTTSAITMWLK